MRFDGDRRRDDIVLGPRSGFARGARDARALRLRGCGRVERFPLALSLPSGLAVGPWTPHLPLPFPIRLRVLPRIDLAAHDDPHEAREHVRGAMQRALDEMARDA